MRFTTKLDMVMMLVVLVFLCLYCPALVGCILGNEVINYIVEDGLLEGDTLAKLRKCFLAAKALMIA